MATRRDFLRSFPLISSAMALEVTTSCQTGLSGSPKDIGIQLWTVRDNISADLNSALISLSEMGYNTIEAYGFDGSFFGQSAKDFSRLTADLGLRLLSTHTNINSENAAAFAEKASESGLEYLILPSMMGRPAKNPDDFRRLAEEMNTIGEICKKNDIKFGYHNHDFEFVTIENEIPYNLLLKETDPQLVSFQLDIYWMVKSGYDPTAYFRNYPGRFTTWHIKDKGNDGETCIVGNGVIDFKSLLQHRKEAGLKDIFVEQEHYAEGTPLYCAGQSQAYIKKHLF